MGVKEWSERLEEMIRTPLRDYLNNPKVTTLRLGCQVYYLFFII